MYKILLIDYLFNIKRIIIHFSVLQQIAKFRIENR